MAESAPSTMTGGAADWLAWLTDPKAPMPLDLSSKRAGTPYGGRTYGGQTYGGQTYGDPNAAAAIAAQPSGVPDVSSIVQYATNPKAPPPDVSISGPDLSGLSAPPSLGQSARAPAQPPRATAPWPTGPQPAIAQTTPNRFGPRIPTPGAPPESQNTSNMLDTVMGWFGRGNTPSQAIISDATAATTDPTTQRVRGMPQVQPKGASFLGPTAMGGTPPPPPPPVPSPVPATPAVPSPSQQQPGVPPGPPGAPPAPTVPEDQSDNVAMGTGPGHAVSHDQAAAISGAAVNLGTKVAQDPSIVSSILRDLSTKGLSDNDENAWLALANAGFATMASRSPNVGQAIGEGAQAGLASYQQSRAARAQQLTSAAGLAQRQQGIEQQGKYQEGQLSVEQQKLVNDSMKTNADVDIAYKKLPAEIQDLVSRADYYKQFAQYRDAQAGRVGSGGGGSGGGGGGSGAKPGSPTYIRDVVAQQYMADHPEASTAEAYMFANTQVAGRQDQARNTYIRQSLTAMGFSMVPGDPNEAPTDIVDKIGAKYDADHAGGATAPVRTASAAPAGGDQKPVGPAPGQPDGATANKGQLVARGGQWYPAATQ